MNDARLVLAQFLSNEAVAWILCGALAIGALLWQYRLVINDIQHLGDMDTRGPLAIIPGRVRASVVVCALLAVAIAIQTFISVQDRPDSSFPLNEIVSSLVAFLPFVLIFAVQSLFGPVLTLGALASIIAYSLLRDTVVVPRLIQMIYGAAMAFLPYWLREFYVIGFVIFAFLTSWRDIIDFSEE